jgi:mannobiose 2-epimerase
MLANMSKLPATAIVSLAFAANLASDPLPQHAAAYRAQLTQRILPYWLGKLDATNGGFLLSDDAVRGFSLPREKQLVSQARMVWTFAHAHRHGLDDANQSCLKAAWNGYRFLTNHFLDPAHGGYYWKTDLAGQTVNDRKIIYGESFVMYAFVELHRATKAKPPLDEAMRLYRLLQRQAHDPQNRGWHEHFTRDWKRLADRDPSAEVEVAGFKSANTHLHLQEALAELYDVTRDPDVKQSLLESLDLNKRYFYPKDAGQSCFHRQPDWKEVTDPRSAGLSYGHNVEFAWLMIRAEAVLGQQPDWPHFYAHLDHALEHGYDHERGGLYHRGIGNEPASDQNKIWWVEAEMMAALTDALRHEENAAQRKALEQLIHFVNDYQTDPRSGIWLDTVTPDGKPKSTGLAHSWKANYHDVRALVKFSEAFASSRR